MNEIIVSKKVEEIIPSANEDQLKGMDVYRVQLIENLCSATLNTLVTFKRNAYGSIEMSNNKKLVRKHIEAAIAQLEIEIEAQFEGIQSSFDNIAYDDAEYVVVVEEEAATA